MPRFSWSTGTPMQKKAMRSWRTLIVATFTPAVIALALWIFGTLTPLHSEHYPWPVSLLFRTDSFPLIVLGCFFLSVLMVLLLYLQTGFSQDDYVRTFIRRHRDELRVRKASAEPPQSSYISELSAVPVVAEIVAPPVPVALLTEAERTTLVTAVKDHILASASSEVLRHFESLDERVELVRKLHEMDKRASVTLARLANAIRALGLRANVNLVIAFAVTTVGVSILMWFISKQPALTVDDPIAHLSYYLPRAVVVVLVEIFAYFFLQLYRTGLYDIKYYNNEMSNVEAQVRAVIAAAASGDVAAVTELIKHIGQTDRNKVSEAPTAAGAAGADKLLELASQALKVASEKK